MYKGDNDICILIVPDKGKFYWSRIQQIIFWIPKGKQSSWAEWCLAINQNNRAQATRKAARIVLEQTK